MPEKIDSRALLSGDRRALAARRRAPRRDARAAVPPAERAGRRHAAAGAARRRSHLGFDAQGQPPRQRVHARQAQRLGRGDDALVRGQVAARSLAGLGRPGAV